MCRWRRVIYSHDPSKNCNHEGIRYDQCCDSGPITQQIPIGPRSDTTRPNNTCGNLTETEADDWGMLCPECRGPPKKKVESKKRTTTTTAESHYIPKKALRALRTFPQQPQPGIGAAGPVVASAAPEGAVPASAMPATRTMPTLDSILNKAPEYPEAPLISAPSGNWPYTGPGYHYDPKEAQEEVERNRRSGSPSPDDVPMMEEGSGEEMK